MLCEVGCVHGNISTAGRTRRELRQRMMDVLPISTPYDQFKNHRFIFVGGSPQSGTSFLRKLLVTNHSSGQEKCMQYSLYKNTNVEGQWLLDGVSPKDQEFKAYYGAGRLDVFLTETDTNKGIINQGDFREYLWRSWSRFWDTDKLFLVEKSPPNFLKMRFLSQLFSVYYPCKFLIILKDPIGNSHFDHPRVCAPDVLKGDCSKTVLSMIFGMKTDSETLKIVSCIEEKNHCRDSLSSKLYYLAQWLTGHETMLSHLSSWPTSKQQVRVVRYEHLFDACVCEKLVTFAYSDEKNEKLLIPFQDVEEACKFEKCKKDVVSPSPPPSSSSSSSSSSSTSNNTSVAVFYTIDELRRNKQLHINVPPSHRKLKYNGDLKSDTIIAGNKNANAERRYELWKSSLYSLEKSRPLTDKVLSDISKYDRRLNKFGYSVLHPASKRLYLANDLFSPWAI
jgi:hypothetical protein